MINIDYWKMLEPMKYYDKSDEGLSDALTKKRNAMVENEGDAFIATRKWDGEWCMFIKWDGIIHLRSRSISKVTGAYGDKTAHLPHLVEEMAQWPDHTVILGEVCWLDDTKVSTDVGTILRCLPEKAVARQEKDKLYVKCFDCLALNGEVYMDQPYEKRLTYLLMLIPTMDVKYFDVTDICPPSLTPAQFADNIISIGGEGAVIQRRDCLYEPGKRSAWHTLKLKQRLPEMELKVINTIDANREYSGKYPEGWPYWEGDTPVTKPYALGWKMGVAVDFNGTTVNVSSGLTDEDREWLASENAQQYISNNQLYATIKGMMVASLGGIRHPVITKLRIMDEAMLDEH